jgi:hypothetical protein
MPSLDTKISLKPLLIGNFITLMHSSLNFQIFIVLSNEAEAKYKPFDNTTSEDILPK